VGQIGDNEDEDEPSKDYRAQLQALGARVQQLRGRVSLRVLAKEVNSSSSTLSRLERGERLPEAALIERLDLLFGLGGSLIAQRDRLFSLQARKRGDAVWRRLWWHYYPAEYSGEVHMSLLLPPGARGRVRLRVSWGPWRLVRSFRVEDPEGILLSHLKGEDGESIIVVVQLDRPGLVRFGTGPPPRPAIDVNEGWYRLGDE
jgi:transcriptional regulator with XRE-family HTH domain